MEHRKQHLPLIAVAVGLLALGSGCVTGDTARIGAKKPDVTQPGVLPPPQDMMKPASAVGPGGAVVPAGGVQPGPAPAASLPLGAMAPAPTGPSLAKLTARPEKKVPASEMAVAWRNRIAYLPDPSRNGVMGAGLAGQLFLFGGPKLEFASADGTLTVDLIDVTPRPAGQPPATPERWQFNAQMLKNLRTTDETFGKSYVLFLPWSAYKADITKVQISARYDPESGYTLFSPPSVITLDGSAPLGAPVWDGVMTTTPSGGMGGMGPMNNRLQQPFGGGMPPANSPPPGAFPGAMMPPAGGTMPAGVMMPAPSGLMPIMPQQPGFGMPAGTMQLGPVTNEPLAPLVMTVGPR